MSGKLHALVKPGDVLLVMPQRKKHEPTVDSIHKNTARTSFAMRISVRGLGVRWESLMHDSLLPGSHKKGRAPLGRRPHACYGKGGRVAAIATVQYQKANASHGGWHDVQHAHTHNAPVQKERSTSNKEVIRGRGILFFDYRKHIIPNHTHERKKPHWLVLHPLVLCTFQGNRPPHPWTGSHTRGRSTPVSCAPGRSISGRT